MPQIFVFGDSITYGAWDKEGGWVQRLRRFLDEKVLTSSDFYYLVYNLGVSGDNTCDLLKRFKFEIEQRFCKNEKAIVIFAIGINDSQFVQSKNSNQVSEEQFKENLEKLIKLARNFTSIIVFVGLTPVDESKTTPIPWNTDKFYKNEYIQRYNEIIKKVCKNNNLHYIEIFEEFAETNYQELLEDGLHPNSEGHQKIFEIVKNYLVENGIIVIS